MKAEFITILIFAIFVTVDLYSIVGEMYVGVIIFYVIVIATCSDVSIIIPVPFYWAILYYLIVTNRTKSI